MLYAIPTLEERRKSTAATWAYFALVVAEAKRVHGVDHVVIPCYTCGACGNADWCNTCEMQDNRPGKAKGAWTPMCRQCEDADMKCRICGIRPSQGPKDEEMGNAWNVVH